MSLEKEVFRWLGPKGITAGYTTSMHEIMAVRGATNVCRIRTSPTIETSRTDLAALSRPKEAVGRRLFLYWEATGEKIEAEVLSYDHRRKLHYLWYRDGELEWVDLKRERFAWVDDKNNNRLVREFPAGLDEGRCWFVRSLQDVYTPQARQYLAEKRPLVGASRCTGVKTFSSMTDAFQVRVAGS